MKKFGRSSEHRAMLMKSLVTNLILAESIKTTLPKAKEARNGIVESTGAQIDIDDDGKVSIFATSLESMEAAKRAVGAVSAVAEPGKIYEGKVTGIKDFGAFVEILPGMDGLCHISEFSDKFLKSMDGVCKVGDIIKVKCIDVDERGRIKLSRKAAMAELDASAR